MRLPGRNTKILEKHKLSKLIQEETENTRRPVTHKEVEFSLLTPAIRKILGPDGFIGEFYPIFKEEWISTLHKHFQKKKRRGRTTSPLTLYGWYYSHSLPYIRASQVALVVKNPPEMQETQEMQDLTLGWEDPLEKEMATRSSILAWRIPWTEEPKELQSMRSEGQDRATWHTLPTVSGSLSWPPLPRCSSPVMSPAFASSCLSLAQGMLCA